MTKSVFAWHFLHEGNKLRDGKKAPADGVWLKYPGKPVLGQQGLHASLDPFDALQYAPGPILCYVECQGEIHYQHDKLVATKRKIIARMDATEMMYFFAKQQVLSVIHLWTPPQIVLEYLMGGLDKEVQDAARVAAGDAAWVADRAGARVAAWVAARAAAREATGTAARVAAVCDRAGVRVAAWVAARKDFTALVHECFEGVLK